MDTPATKLKTEKMKVGGGPGIGQALGSIAFGTSAFTSKLTDIKGPAFKREWLDTTSMATVAAGANQVGNKTGIPSFYTDPGELTMTLLHDTQQAPPLGGDLEAITIAIGPYNSSQATITGYGAMLDYQIDAPLDGKVMTATAKVRFSGPLTFTAAS
jgi:hypothetical protein